MLDDGQEHSFGGDNNFDDCPVCQAQKKADDESREITENELIEAMKGAKKHGAIVGGSLFQDE